LSQAVQVPQAGAGDPSAGQVQHAQGSQPAQVFQAGISHLGVLEVQILEARQPSKVDQAGVGECGVFQVEGDELGQTVQRCQAGMGDRGEAKAQPVQPVQAVDVFQTRAFYERAQEVKCLKLGQPLEVLQVDVGNSGAVKIHRHDRVAALVVVHVHL